jgi:hypothetical protein
MRNTIAWRDFARWGSFGERRMDRTTDDLLEDLRDLLDLLLQKEDLDQQDLRLLGYCISRLQKVVAFYDEVTDKIRP